MTELLIFVPACFALNMAFGPNNLLALTHGIQSGVGFAVTAGLARLLVFVPMIAISACGLGFLLSTSALVFTCVKLAGAAYLVWLGLRLVRVSMHRTAPEYPSHPTGVMDAFRREALVALGNPKAILIFAAFFPQFVDPDRFAQSYLLLGSVFLALELLAVSLYAVAGRFAARATGSRLHWCQRVSGFGMVAFGCMLLFLEPADAGPS